MALKAALFDERASFRAAPFRLLGGRRIGPVDGDELDQAKKHQSTDHDK
jgi:hypothetical protein